MKRLSFILYIFIAAGFFAGLFAQDLSEPKTRYYRSIEADPFGLIRGVYPIDERESFRVNCYALTPDAEGRPLRIEYLNSGRALSDPRFGVALMAFESNARKSARATMCLANLRQVTQSLMMYGAELDGIPPGESYTQSGTAVKWNNGTWDARMMPYMTNGRTWPGSVADGGTSYTVRIELCPKILECPEDNVKRSRDEGKRSYTANTGFLNGVTNQYSGGFSKATAIEDTAAKTTDFSPTTVKWVTTKDILQPASLVAFADGWRSTGTNSGGQNSSHQVFGCGRYQTGVQNSLATFDAKSDGTGIKSISDYPHNDAANFAFFDGHVITSNNTMDKSYFHR